MNCFKGRKTHTHARAHTLKSRKTICSRGDQSGNQKHGRKKKVSSAKFCLYFIILLIVLLTGSKARAHMSAVYTVGYLSGVGTNDLINYIGRSLIVSAPGKKLETPSTMTKLIDLSFIRSTGCCGCCCCRRCRCISQRLPSRYSRWQSLKPLYNNKTCFLLLLISMYFYTQVDVTLLPQLATLHSRTQGTTSLSACTWPFLSTFLLFIFILKIKWKESKYKKVGLTRLDVSLEPKKGNRRNEKGLQCTNN